MTTAKEPTKSTFFPTEAFSRRCVLKKDTKGLQGGGVIIDLVFEKMRFSKKWMVYTKNHNDPQLYIAILREEFDEFFEFR